MTLSTSAVIRRGRPSPASLDLRSLLKWGHWNSQIGGAITKEYLFKDAISNRPPVGTKTGRVPGIHQDGCLAPVTQNQWVPISIEDLSCILFDLSLKIFRILRF